MGTAAFKKLELIQQKIGQLTQERALAEKAIAQELLGILKKLNAFQWDFEVLVGGLVEMATKAKEPQGEEALFNKGEMFLKGKRPGIKKSVSPGVKPETQDADALATTTA